MSGKRKTKKDEQIAYLEEKLQSNVFAIKEGKKKPLTIHDLQAIKPLTEPQRMMMESFFSGNHIVADGMAGSGKTFVAMYLALQDILSRESKRDKIIIVRAAANSVSLGFTPGTLEEKMEVYESPYISIVEALTSHSSSYEILKKTGKIEFKISSYVRGESWDNAVIVCDEFQSFQEVDVDTVMTRVGKNSRVIVCGDTHQNELKHKKHMESGYAYFLAIAQRMQCFDTITFRVDDVVRSGFVKDYLMAKFSD